MFTKSGSTVYKALLALITDNSGKLALNDQRLAEQREGGFLFMCYVVVTNICACQVWHACKRYINYACLLCIHFRLLIVVHCFWDYNGAFCI